MKNFLLKGRSLMFIKRFWYPGIFPGTKIVRIMKLITILCCVVCVQLSATKVDAQLVSLDERDAKLEQVFLKIRKQTGYNFLFNNRVLESARPVTVRFQNMALDRALQNVFAEQPLTYSIIEKTIVVKEAEDKLRGQKTNKLQTIDVYIAPFVDEEILAGVSGIVTESSGEALIGVNVTVKGTARGTTTDFNGRYEVEADLADTLVFSYIGYSTIEVPVNGRSQINVTMSVNAAELEELVVVGYGVQKKVTLTGSVSTVDPEVMKLNPVGNVTRSLQGQVSGVSVASPNTPGDDAKIRIRGLGTINDNNPLWVVDGIPRAGGINQINPTDIESISILKDASATAIYGSRGSNGVILVTTKQGSRSQKPEISVNSRYGVLQNFRQYETLNPQEYGEMLWLQFANSGVAPSHPIYGSGSEPQIPAYVFPAGANSVDESLYDINSYPITRANSEGTNWADEVLSDGTLQNHTISITGGSENTIYRFSGSMLKENGILVKTGFERYNLGTSVTSDLNKWLQVGQNLNLSFTNDWGYQDQGGRGTPFGMLLDLPAITPIYDIMGNWSPVSRVVGLLANNNLPARLERRKDFTDKDFILLGNIFAKVNFFKWFSYKTTFGMNFGNGSRRQPLEANPESYVARQYDELTEYYSEGRQWNWINTLNYDLEMSKNQNISFLLGTEAINSYNRNITASRSQFFLTNEDYYILNAGESNIQNTGAASDWAIFSLFGRARYDYDDKYLLDVTVRRDGSSRFGANNRYAMFPAFSVGWVPSQESFLSETNDWLDFLKVRFSWGQSGNDRIGNYNGFTTFLQSREKSYYPITGSNSSVTTGYESGSFGNPNARWETTTTTNLGIDATFLRNLDMSVDFWSRYTTDMLYQLRIPQMLGQASVPFVNVGEMSNKGIDVQLGYRSDISRRDLTYSINLVVSHYKNEIVKLSDDNETEAIIGTDYENQVYTRAEEGTSFPQFYGYMVEGIFQTQAEADNYPEAFGIEGTYNAPGRFKYKDVNGDGVIDDDDRTYIGNPHPDLTAGLTANVQYKDFDLIASFYSSIGNDIINLNRRYLDFNVQETNRGTRRLYESWGSPYLTDNSKARMPKAELFDEGSQLPSTYFVEDGSFLRLQSVQLGYNLPKSILNTIGFKQIQIYVMVNNVFTISGYSGLDPQLNTSDSNYGIDLGVWPSPRRYLAGINIKI